MILIFQKLSENIENLIFTFKNLKNSNLNLKNSKNSSLVEIEGNFVQNFMIFVLKIKKFTYLFTYL